jgi:urea transport system substrate-binding protein
MLNFAPCFEIILLATAPAAFECWRAFFVLGSRMATRAYPMGILVSTSGSYGTVGRSMLNGALLACAEINATGPVNLQPVHCDPAGVPLAYAASAGSMIEAGTRHIVGCYTSSSRKEVIPLIEKHDALLWYPTHYEGFESSTNVVYTGAAPNHHMSPLVDYLIGNFGSRAFCVGSNYIWAWESNRILRDCIQAKGGVTIAERYIAVGECDLDQIIEMIFDTEPDFVFNTLIGSSAYAFFETFRRACRARGIDQVARYPVASCNLSEPDLSEIAVDCRDGHLSSSVYFSSLQSAENDRFVASYRTHFPDGPAVSAEGEAAYIATHLLAKALAIAGSDTAADVYGAVAGLSMQAPQGRVAIDRETHHAFLTPRLGRSRADGAFDIVAEARSAVRPDPYMVGVLQSSPRASASPQPRRPFGPKLRIVP